MARLLDIRRTFIQSACYRDQDAIKAQTMEMDATAVDVLPVFQTTDSWKTPIYRLWPDRGIFHGEVTVQQAADRPHPNTSEPRETGTRSEEFWRWRGRWTHEAARRAL
jgi:hypothetical protein